MRDDNARAFQQASSSAMRAGDIGTTAASKGDHVKVVSSRLETIAVAVPCVNDPTKDCVLCTQFDECSYPDRQSSLMSVALALILGGIVVLSTLLYFMLD